MNAVNGYSVQLLMPESNDEADTSMILSEPFSMGLAFSSDLTDTLLSTVRYPFATLPLIPIQYNVHYYIVQGCIHVIQKCHVSCNIHTYTMDYKKYTIHTRSRWIFQFNGINRANGKTRINNVTPLYIRIVYSSTIQSPTSHFHSHSRKWINNLLFITLRGCKGHLFLEISTGPKFPALPANLFCSARPRINILLCTKIVQCFNCWGAQTFS